PAFARETWLVLMLGCGLTREFWEFGVQCCNAFLTRAAQVARLFAASAATLPAAAGVLRCEHEVLALVTAGPLGHMLGQRLIANDCGTVLNRRLAAQHCFGG